MVRTLAELAKLVEEGKTNEITEKEIEAITILAEALMEVLKPVQKAIEEIADNFLEFFQKTT